MFVDSFFFVRFCYGDGSFEKLVELLVGVKFREEESVNVDVVVLSGIVKEVEDLREVMVGLKKRYIGVKVSCCCIIFFWKFVMLNCFLL